MLLRQAVPLPPKVILRQSALPRQLIPGKIALLRQSVPLPPNSCFQAVSTDPQVVSTSASQAGSSEEDSTSQAASTSSQTHNTNSQGASATLPQASRQPTSANTPWGSPRGNSLENPNPKWVINLSSEPLTQTQRSVLAKGPNFVVAPRHPPNLQYIMAIEVACTKLGQQDAEELRDEINRVLTSCHTPKPNLTKAQSEALR